MITNTPSAAMIGHGPRTEVTTNEGAVCDTLASSGNVAAARRFGRVSFDGPAFVRPLDATASPSPVPNGSALIVNPRRSTSRRSSRAVAGRSSFFFSSNPITSASMLGGMCTGGSSSSNGGGEVVRCLSMIAADEPATKGRLPLRHSYAVMPRL